MLCFSRGNFKQSEDFSIMMMRSFLALGLVLLFSSPVQAESIKDQIENSGQYWQRVNASSSIYLRGPKAQQILNRDIARCVVELRELERLGAVKDAIPEYAEGIVLSEAEAHMAGIDTPERDDELYAEHADYSDFEGCMLEDGWERIKYVPFEQAAQAQDNYLSTHEQYRKQYNASKNGSATKSGGDYDHLNE